MLDPGSYGIVGRLALAAFVSVAPTLLFLGLVRGLERLRDDALLLELRHREDVDVSPNDDVLDVLADGLEFDRADRSEYRCPSCETPNDSNARYCRECLAQLAEG
ncbi:zinc ribbon domain-containing protein [Natronococcus occultus]|uniref:DUF7577 domain-containing protein n=1 Tax=Natronococcus occultus SP4 TaxID=694430 RepID=L0K376_9EURY|nr:zinc ribbon domain-containing protein [Natronococcus occultus]AGB39461.1 hypothetical protein Natoc_3748 [Natronococcus occultus SP4]